MMDLKILIDKVVDLEYDDVLKIAVRALDLDIAPNEIIAAITLGLDKVGELYKSGEYSISDLMMAGIIFEDILGLDVMVERMKFRGEGSMNLVSDVLLLGTIEGDIHDIGKTIFSSLAVSVGYHVIDLGTDVASESFLEAALEYQPNIIGISAVLSNTIPALKRTVELLKSNDKTKDCFTIIGGTIANAEVLEYTGADACTQSAREGVDLCMKQKKMPFDKERNNDE
ncbi:cobalamin B12-binding domain-containing protein [Eubacterium sp.]|uniref:cobalamin B12-binding domain-containing protein n=1 Tax=Eubacterium sp. TaxID=142586 RepID=UPI002FC95AAF